MMDPFTSTLDLAGAIRRRDVSPIEVAEMFLERIERLDPEINAFAWCDPGEVRDAAKRATVEGADGDDRLPAFHGVPIPIKDNTPVDGWPVTHGSNGASAALGEETDLAVQALRGAGFLLMGRTTMPELGAFTTTESERYGITRNPWDLSRSPGGSTGGGAAAVAAGMAPLAHGTDGGGSLRMPASSCGIVGFKSSRGRVPRTGEWWEGADIAGVMTRTVADAAAVLDAISGHDPLAWYNAPKPARPFLHEIGAEPGRQRIGLLERAPLGTAVDEECISAVRSTAALLEDLGHEVVPVDFELVDEPAVAAMQLVVAAGFGLVDPYIEDWDRVESRNAHLLAAAREVRAPDYVAAVGRLQRWSRGIVARWARDFDVLLTPTMAIEPPPAGAVLAAAQEQPAEFPATMRAMFAFTVVANITGLPAISLPTYWTSEGVPIGSQLIGGPWRESDLLRVASQIESARPWCERRPADGGS